MVTKDRQIKPDIIDIEESITNTKSFAKGINFYKLVWIFTIGAILGFIVESLFCIAMLGHLESRAGLIWGPFKPIYGFGAVLFTIVLYKIRHLNSFLIFLLTAVIGAVFEIVCSLFEEYVFGVSYWEYSDSFLNIDGRTNLFFAICWGILGLLFIKHIYPFISRIIRKIPNKVGIPLTWIIFVFLIIDITLTGCAIWRCVDRNYDIDPDNLFELFLDKHYPDEFMSALFPNMTIL